MRGPARLPCVLACICVFACVFALAATGCGSDSGESPPTIRVFAASSTIDVLNEIAEAYEPDDGTIEFNFAGSNALREQILDGASADVFISANAAVMDELLEAGLTVGDPVEIARNSLTIVVPLGNAAGISGLGDFADSGLSLGLCAPGVPCGDLAASVLANAGVDASVDTLEPNVRSLLSKVELGELDGALVYRTDALASDEVEPVALDQELAGTTSYSAVALEGSGPNAQRFVDYLLAENGRRVFADAGFGLP